MANELTISGGIWYLDAEGFFAQLQIPMVSQSPATLRPLHQKQNVGTSPVALNLGALATIGWGILINRDVTNYISLLTGTGGVNMAKLLPGTPTTIYFGSGAQAPFVQANTAACDLEYLLSPQ